VRPLFGPLYLPRMMDDECGAVGAISNLKETPAPVPLYPPQITHDLTRASVMCRRVLCMRAPVLVLVCACVRALDGWST
jgi:hypothetical protein